MVLTEQHSFQDDFEYASLTIYPPCWMEEVSHLLAQQLRVSDKFHFGVMLSVSIILDIEATQCFSYCKREVKLRSMVSYVDCKVVVTITTLSIVAVHSIHALDCWCILNVAIACFRIEELRLEALLHKCFMLNVTVIYWLIVDFTNITDQSYAHTCSITLAVHSTHAFNQTKSLVDKHYSPKTMSLSLLSAVGSNLSKFGNQRNTWDINAPSSFSVVTYRHHCTRCCQVTDFKQCSTQLIIHRLSCDLLVEEMH